MNKLTDFAWLWFGLVTLVSFVWQTGTVALTIKLEIELIDLI
jgi:hypothetical protein